MDYASESIEAELYRLRTKTRELEIELDTLNTQNVRLAKENSVLSNDFNLRTIEAKTATSINAELRLMLFKAENERDELNGSLQSLKQKYNKLYDKYAVKDRTFRAINETFRDGNRLRPIIKPDNSRPKFQRPESHLPKTSSECDTLTLELNKNLEDAYDKIEELEFELESLEVLEHENQHLRTELNQIKRKSSMDSSISSSTSKIASSSILQQQRQNSISSSSSSSSSSILRTSATISQLYGDNRYSSATTVRAEEFQGYNKNNNNNKSIIQSSIRTPPPSTALSSKFYIDNENIYEQIDETIKYTTNINTTSNKNINDDWAIIDNDDDDDNNNQVIYRDDGNNIGVVVSDNGSFRRKPNIASKPSFISGAKHSIGSGEANDAKKMINLVDELQQFKFKNSSQGPKNV